MLRKRSREGIDHVASASDIDSLFQLPLAEFTAARNALAAQLKKAGRRDESHQVKAMAKPSISAWAANQLYWRERKAFDRLMASGEQFRQAQASQLAGRSADLRRPLEARRGALADLSRLAAAALTEAGHTPTPEMMRRVTTTLEAISTYGDTPNGPRPGRLLDDVDPPGFDTLAALVPSVGREGRASGERSTVLPFHAASRRQPVSAKAGRSAAALEAEEQARRAAAKAARQQAERQLREARVAAERAKAEMKKAAARVKAAETARADAERRLEEASASLADAKQAARKVAAEAETAADAVAEAERALDRV
jgi:hypothetical protein